MPLHRRGKPYSPAYLREKLASLTSQIAALRASGRAGDKGRADRLEVDLLRFERLANPRPVEEYRLPF